eukprot:TRINITY_DN57428_c0_g1_i1.p1 TRINITY_DN57428_c0_g1~~TRINITY_DN57428_c0_g1_i1.p1  ORF type:complete len:284 (-),score=52.87 TRINITY_DN57428_c0_g1_i1:168-962(-)
MCLTSVPALGLLLLTLAPCQAANSTLQVLAPPEDSRLWSWPWSHKQTPVPAAPTPVPAASPHFGRMAVDGLPCEHGWTATWPDSSRSTCRTYCCYHRDRKTGIRTAHSFCRVREAGHEVLRQCVPRAFAQHHPVAPAEIGIRRRRSVPSVPSALLGLSKEAAAGARDLDGSSALEKLELLPRQITDLSSKQSEEGEELLEDAESDDAETFDAGDARSPIAVLRAASMAGFVAAGAILWALVRSGSVNSPWSNAGATHYQPLLES